MNIYRISPSALLFIPSGPKKAYKLPLFIPICLDLPPKYQFKLDFVYTEQIVYKQKRLSSPRYLSCLWLHHRMSPKFYTFFQFFFDFWHFGHYWTQSPKFLFKNGIIHLLSYISIFFIIVIYFKHSQDFPIRNFILMKERLFYAGCFRHLFSKLSKKKE